MECRDIQHLLTAYADGEVAVPETLDIERHMGSCPGCRAEHATQVTLRAAIKRDMTYFHAPERLASRIRASLPRAVRAEPPRARWSWNWTNTGFALATLASIAWSVGLYLSTPSPEDRLAQDAVASHVRSLLSDHTVDVVSTDRHTVKPWFAGKIDFAPTVYDLAAEGYTLVGGRLDYLNHRTVAALVYRYRQHVISLFMAPVTDEKIAVPASFAAQGFQVVHWTLGQMDCWAVSDTDATSLAKFKDVFIAAR